VAATLSQVSRPRAIKSQHSHPVTAQLSQASTQQLSSEAAILQQQHQHDVMKAAEVAKLAEATSKLAELRSIVSPRSRVEFILSY